MRPRWAMALGCLCLGLGAAWGPLAFAQDLSGERVRAALEATDERIALAQSLLTETENAQARLEVESAIGLQTQAQQAFEQAMASTGDLQLRLLRQALDLTLRARGHADRAIALIRGLPDPERVRAQVERTADLIESARTRLADCARDRAQALLRVAGEMQRRASAALTDGRYLAALQLTLGARERALRALRICDMVDTLEETCERALRRSDEVIERAREAVAETGGIAAQDLLNRAQRIQVEARGDLRERRFDSALRRTRNASDLAQRALRLARPR